jgi:replicative DNA helicase
MISRSLKAIAKELNIPVIALSQLSRSVETRSATNKRPQLSDLRESGAIEQDADIVSFIYRPEYYKLPNWDNDPEDVQTSTTNQAEIIVAKHRNGTTDDVRLAFLKNMGKFADLEALNSYSGYSNSSFANQTEPSGFDSIRTTIASPSNAFNLGENNNLSASSMNDDDGDMPF